MVLKSTIWKTGSDPSYTDLYVLILYPLAKKGRLAVLVRSHINGLILFERVIEQTTETMPPSPKTTP